MTTQKQKELMRVRCGKRPQQDGSWCNRCEMADRAWQVEVWDGHRISNADAISVYGFKSRADMEKAWEEAHLFERESRFNYDIDGTTGSVG